MDDSPSANIFSTCGLQLRLPGSLLGELNGPLHHIPGVLRADSTPAVPLHRFVETKLFGQLRLQFFRHHASSSAAHLLKFLLSGYR